MARTGGAGGMKILLRVCRVRDVGGVTGWCGLRIRIKGAAMHLGG